MEIAGTSAISLICPSLSYSVRIANLFNLPLSHHRIKAEFPRLRVDCDEIVKKLIGIINKAFGLRECLLISGFVALAYGLYRWFGIGPSLTVCGSLLITGGLFFMKAE